MDEVSGHHLVLCHTQDALHHSKMSSCSRTQTESSKPIGSSKAAHHDHMPHKTTFQRSEQPASCVLTDLRQAAERKQRGRTIQPISCWGDETVNLQLAEQSRLQSWSVL